MKGADDSMVGYVVDIFVIFVSVAIGWILSQRESRKQAYNLLHEKLFEVLTDLEFHVRVRWAENKQSNDLKDSADDCEILRLLTKTSKYLRDFEAFKKNGISENLRDIKYVKLRQAASLDKKFSCKERLLICEEFREIALKEFPFKR